MKVHDIPSNHRRAIIGASLLLLTATGAAAWWTWKSASPFPPNQPTVAAKMQQAPATLRTEKPPKQVQEAIALPVEPPKSAANPATQSTTAAQPEIYWLQTERSQISLVPQQVALADALSAEQALREGVVNLLANPGTTDRRSAIPPETRLLSLRTTPTGIYINLSREFNQGGGSSSMIHRVAQILYTVTSLEPNAKVYLSVEGQPLDENHPLGGEGLVLRQPLTRQEFARDFSVN